MPVIQCDLPGRGQFCPVAPYASRQPVVTVLQQGAVREVIAFQNTLRRGFGLTSCQYYSRSRWYLSEFPRKLLLRRPTRLWGGRSGEGQGCRCGRSLPASGPVLSFLILSVVMGFQDDFAQQLANAYGHVPPRRWSSGMECLSNRTSLYWQPSGGPLKTANLF